ncbi:GerAB/ArcD/ProY family transporter [Clostridium fungisolvens]|uniref:Spore germination protein YndE n=1 Tax=Clostridium fungisolvens TaxID=1604897 RepID=A0A6V8SAZ6_9CLOT|nr:endospore germination permease [Clostridium fungisolvens]GFP74424.1 Spore germination protein YndE [Clostridium fungisolvens]
MNKFLTNRQISVILFSVIVGYTVTSLPKNIAEKAGTASWLVLLIGTIIFIFITYIIIFLQNVYEGKTIYEYGQQLVGKFIAFIFLILYLVYFFTYFTMFIRGASESIKTNILAKTPLIYISIIFSIVIGYSLIKGINVIARACEIYVTIIILGYILIFFLLATQGQLVNIKPLFVASDIVKYFEAIPRTSLPFLGMEILLFIPISRSENKNIYRYTLLMIGFIGILYIYIVESVISVVGVELVVMLNSPVVSVLRGIDIPSLEFIRRVDGIYFIFRMMNLSCGISIWGYGIAFILNKIFRSVNYSFMVIIIIFISIIVSQIPNTTFMQELIIKYNSYLGIVLVFVIPVILFIITKVKKYDKKI